MTFDYAKIITTVVWILVIANLFVSFPHYAALTLHATGLVLVISHLAECVVFHQEIMAKPHSRPLAYLLTFLFGVLYLKNWPTDPWHGKK